MGEHNINNDTDCDIQDQVRVCAPPIQDLAISEVIPHPRYSSTRFENDIGLLRLATPASVELGKYFNNSSLFDNSQCSINKVLFMSVL